MVGAMLRQLGEQALPVEPGSAEVTPVKGQQACGGDARDAKQMVDSCFHGNCFDENKN